MISDFLAYLWTYLPTPVQCCPNINFQFYYMVSDFGKSTYLPKNMTSFMDVPLYKNRKSIYLGYLSCQYLLRHQVHQLHWIVGQNSHLEYLQSLQFFYQKWILRLVLVPCKVLSALWKCFQWDFVTKFHKILKLQLNQDTFYFGFAQNAIN